MLVMANRKRVDDDTRLAALEQAHAAAGLTEEIERHSTAIEDLSCQRRHRMLDAADGLTYAELAEIVRVSEPTVWKQLSRARDEVEEGLTPELGCVPR